MALTPKERLSTLTLSHVNQLLAEKQTNVALQILPERHKSTAEVWSVHWQRIFSHERNAITASTQTAISPVFAPQTREVVVCGGGAKWRLKLEQRTPYRLKLTLHLPKTGQSVRCRKGDTVKDLHLACCSTCKADLFWDRRTCADSLSLRMFWTSVLKLIHLHAQGLWHKCLKLNVWQQYRTMCLSARVRYCYLSWYCHVWATVKQSWTVLWTGNHAQTVQCRKVRHCWNGNSVASWACCFQKVQCLEK